MAANSWFILSTIYLNYQKYKSLFLMIGSTLPILQKTVSHCDIEWTGISFIKAKRIVIVYGSVFVTTV